MAVIQYAVKADLLTYLNVDSLPAVSDTEITRLLARAQDLIDMELNKRIFVVDNFTDGNPTDAAVLAAVKRATVAQVESWLASGDELGELAGVSSYSIEGIAISRADADMRRKARLCDRALDALRVVPIWLSVS
jgi:hypothetical protein